MTRAYVTIGILGLMLTGCQAAQQPTNGLAELRVTARAEPKQGVRPPPRDVSVYDKPSAPDRGAFEPVDYASLENIVVWVEPAGGIIPATAFSQIGPPVRVDVTDHPPADGKLSAVGVGHNLVLTNRSGRTISVYSVSDGNDFDLGALAPGAEGWYAVRSPGLIEVLAESVEQPIARIYAAPTPSVTVTHSGGAVTFVGLQPGPYRIHSWHLRLPGTETTVELFANRVQDASISVGVNALPKEYAK